MTGADTPGKSILFITVFAWLHDLFGIAALPNRRFALSYHPSKLDLEFLGERGAAPPALAKVWDRGLPVWLFGTASIGAAILGRRVEVCNVVVQSTIEKPCHDGLKAPSMKRTKHLGRRFRLNLPSELRLFVHREAYAFF